uniref:Non-specific lipid-transfer protein n=1 Tax=Gossypium raimondii TaxID=29730 RepID=A0A0D2TNP9_GOSRA|nr:hypothetical protein B456_009G117000 [Gossypium raimondii]
MLLIPYLNPSSPFQFHQPIPSSEFHPPATMKSLFFSMLFLLSFLFFLANNGEAAVPCTTVDANAAACLGFATGMAAKPSDACCNGLRQLAQTVKSVDDKKAICRCLKVGAKSLGIQDRFLSMIPQACNIKVDFPVSVNTNCETIH